MSYPAPVREIRSMSAASDIGVHSRSTKLRIQVDQPRDALGLRVHHPSDHLVVLTVRARRSPE
jgi:hypothetical protein